MVKLAFSLAVLQPVAPYQGMPKVRRGLRQLLGNLEQMSCERKPTTWMVARELLVYLDSDLLSELRITVYQMVLQM